MPIVRTNHYSTLINGWLLCRFSRISLILTAYIYIPLSVFKPSYQVCGEEEREEMSDKCAKRIYNRKIKKVNITA